MYEQVVAPAIFAVQVVCTACSDIFCLSNRSSTGYIPGCMCLYTGSSTGCLCKLKHQVDVCSMGKLYR
jgi:hypothetical protein